ncbi:MAG: sigma-54 dependent transcriptional regulator [Nannocystaceae bacterium]
MGGGLSNSDLDSPTLRGSTPPPPRTHGQRLALTILTHPDWRRIGERVELATGAVDLHLEISRRTPNFRTAGGHLVGPLGDRYISRSPLVCSSVGGYLHIDPPARSLVWVDHEPLRSTRRISASALARGVTIEFADRVALLLHHHQGMSDPSTPKFGMLGESRAMSEVRRRIAEVAGLDVPVLVHGASGTGKELVARAIHAASSRSSRRYIAINVAALSREIAAAELFGHERGSFTGAVHSRPGLFREADGGTIFLDEIGEAPVEVQVMLLRVLESGEIQPIGGASSRRVDVRIIAASDVDLEAAMLRGSFRGSLFHRLAGYTIATPSLSRRIDDIPRLLVHFLEQERRRLTPDAAIGGPTEPPRLRASQIVRLLRYPWPGNIRELGNLARRLLASSLVGGDLDQVIDEIVGERASTDDTDGGRGERGMAPSDHESPSPAQSRPRHISDEALVAALRQHKWQLAATARSLGISRSTLDERIKRCPALRRARDLGRDELAAAYAESGGDLETMAATLGVSVRALQLRLRNVDLGADQPALRPK